MSRRYAWALPIAIATLDAVGITAGVASHDDTAIWLAATFAITLPAFAVVGGLISSRHPGNAIGWLLSSIGFMFALVVASANTAHWGGVSGHVPLDALGWIDLGSNAWVIGLGLIGTQLAPRLPDGRLPSERWRWFSRITIVLIAVSLVGMATQPGRVEDVPGTSNPVGNAVTAPLASVFLLVILSFVVGVAGLVMRYRRSSGHDRAQLRWVAFSGALFIGVYLFTQVMLSFVVDENGTAGNIVVSIAGVAFAAFPIGIGFAVLRQNLYDIDVVLNRALVYGSLTAMLAATYLGSVLLLQLLLDRFTQGSGLAVAASTLATAALVRPARARIQATVDRRFFRRKYDAARILQAFGSRLREQVDLDSLTTDLRSVVTDTMQPAHVTLWTPSEGGER
jgi:hypothetical protein